MSISSVSREDLEQAAKRVWWLVLLEGIAAVAFGIFALFYTGSTLRALIVVFGVYAIIDGLLALAGGTMTGQQGRGRLVFQGIMGVVIGVIALRFPEATTFAFLLVIAVWALVIGLVLVVGALEARSVHARGWGWILAGGMVNVLFGLLLVFNPVSGIKVVLWIIGIYAILFGAMLLGSAWAARTLTKELRAGGQV